MICAMTKRLEPISWFNWKSNYYQAKNKKQLKVGGAKY